jgi:hypothetical protein
MGKERKKYDKYERSFKLKLGAMYESETLTKKLCTVDKLRQVKHHHINKVQIHTKMHQLTTSYATDTLQNDCKSKHFYYKSQ